MKRATWVTPNLGRSPWRKAAKTTPSEEAAPEQAALREAEEESAMYGLGRTTTKMTRSGADLVEPRGQEPAQ